ncbi:MAG: hypothetical protein ACI9JN_000891 [Bacteroidia bacterium]|jgi:hypothetical protein
MLIEAPLIFKYFFKSNVRAFAFWPFIVVKDLSFKADKILVNHENIHLKQQLELLIVPFYVIYFIEFLIWYVLLRDFDKAYRRISFEQEAFENDTNSSYLKQRKPFVMWRG